ncbi:hypothetical protein GCM10009802_14080 [Streptomyces synnematoformans]|uniref:Uncharacterized protein n=1 Tax=Streptomyces synnematoformans TaxID=415721 RepID=A0ABN2XPJ9_9ACTN
MSRGPYETAAHTVHADPSTRRPDAGAALRAAARVRRAYPSDVPPRPDGAPDWRRMGGQGTGRAADSRACVRGSGREK